MALIPARGGSVGIKRKNMQLLGGETLVGRAIGVAQRSACSRVVVSTDDYEIAKHSRSLGAEVVMRPPELATSGALPEEAEAHALATLDAQPLAIVRLFPTAPFRIAYDVNACLALLTKHGAAVSVSEPTHWPSQEVEVKRGVISHVHADWQHPRQRWTGRKIIDGVVYAARLDYYERHGFFRSRHRAVRDTRFA